jgi:hypothetical protein
MLNITDSCAVQNQKVLNGDVLRKTIKPYFILDCRYIRYLVLAIFNSNGSTDLIWFLVF